MGPLKRRSYLENTRLVFKMRKSGFLTREEREKGCKSEKTKREEKKEDREIL